jgi:hypothetical protein
VIGQVIDVFVSPRRDVKAARRFLEQAINVTKVAPVEVTTDRAATYPIVLEDLLPAALHRTDQYANNGIECDHGRLKSWMRPMRGLRQDRSARILIAGHGLVQNLRRGHYRGNYEVAVEEPASLRVRSRSRSWPWRSDPSENQASACHPTRCNRAVLTGSLHPSHQHDALLQAQPAPSYAWPEPCH